MWAPLIRLFKKQSESSEEERRAERAALKERLRELELKALEWEAQVRMGKYPDDLKENK